MHACMLLMQGALAKAGLAPGGTIDAANTLVPTLLKAFGQQGFFTCNQG